MAKHNVAPAGKSFLSSEGLLTWTTVIDVTIILTFDVSVPWHTSPLLQIWANTQRTQYSIAKGRPGLWLNNLNKYKKNTPKPKEELVALTDLSAKLLLASPTDRLYSYGSSSHWVTTNHAMKDHQKPINDHHFPSRTHRGIDIARLQA